jgi:dienelactone hydrolase
MPFIGAFVALFASMLSAACTPPARPVAAPSPTPLFLSPASSPSPFAPRHRYAAGMRELSLSRGPARPLRTLVLYPSAGPSGTDVPPAPGRFPLVLFSHGLHSSPERYVAAAAVWASAGFVVALPAYPHTSAAARPYRRADIVQQPADAAYVIDRVRDLDGLPGDPLHGRVDGDRVAAIGHSAGGFTTTGLFAAGHDARLRAGVVLAGWHVRGTFAGPPATMLFVHGDADRVIPLEYGRTAYGLVPWPKSFVLLPGGTHGRWLRPGRPGYDRVVPLVTDFLRWTLYGDPDAGRRVPPSTVPPA